MRTKAKAVLALLVLAALASAGTVPFVLIERDETTITLDGRTANNHGELAVAPDDVEVAFAMGDFYFKPTVLEGSDGQSILLEVVNTGDQRHNLTSPGDRVDVDLGPGESQLVGVTFPPAGNTAVIFCRFFEDEGMVGGLKGGPASPSPPA